MKKNLKTTILGALMLAFTGFQIYANPSMLLTAQGQAQTTSAILTGVGLIQAADAKKDQPGS